MVLEPTTASPLKVHPQSNHRHFMAPVGSRFMPDTGNTWQAVTRPSLSVWRKFGGAHYFPPFLWWYPISWCVNDNDCRQLHNRCSAASRIPGCLWSTFSYMWQVTPGVSERCCVQPVFKSATAVNSWIPVGDFRTPQPITLRLELKNGSGVLLRCRWQRLSAVGWGRFANSDFPQNMSKQNLHAVGWGWFANSDFPHNMSQQNTACCGLRVICKLWLPSEYV